MVNYVFVFLRIFVFVTFCLCVFLSLCVFVFVCFCVFVNLCIFVLVVNLDLSVRKCQGQSGLWSVVNLNLSLCCIALQ